MSLSDSIAAVKALKGAEFFDEITTKQTIVLQLFQSLGWNIFNTRVRRT